MSFYMNEFGTLDPASPPDVRNEFGPLDPASPPDVKDEFGSLDPASPPDVKDEFGSLDPASPPDVKDEFGSLDPASPPDVKDEFGSLDPASPPDVKDEFGSLDPALPPDVRRGFASPPALKTPTGLSPWFGLGPKGFPAKVLTRGLAPNFTGGSAARQSHASHQAAKPGRASQIHSRRGIKILKGVDHCGPASSETRRSD